MSAKALNKTKIYFILLAAVMTLAYACSSSSESKGNRKKGSQENEIVVSNIEGAGQKIEISFIKGKKHNHPTFAIWLEDTEGRYIQTLFVTRAIGQGVFTYGDKKSGHWEPGEVRRPAALPYWAHKRGVKAEDGLYIPSPKNPVPDAYSGATPRGNFQLQSRFDKQMKGKVKVWMEINQTWDWNEYWTNNKYPDDMNYKTSCQPSLVYSSSEIDLESASGDFSLNPVGHGHYSGKDGSLDPDLSTLTTARQIAESISLKVIR